MTEYDYPNLTDNPGNIAVGPDGNLWFLDLSGSAVGEVSGFAVANPPITAAAMQTAVSSSSNPSMIGQQVTFTAAVTATGYLGTPTGTVTFRIDGQAQSPVPLSVVGGADQAQFVTSTLTRGQHSVVASYSGDASFGSSAVSTTLFQSVNPPGSTTTLASSANPSKVGDPVTFTATVTAGSGTFTPGGEVTFSIDGTTEPSVSIQLVNGHDQASFSISTLSAGQHSITASFDGGSMFAESSVITPLTQTVGGPPSVEIPTVALVQRFGIHHEPTVLVVTFTSALDSASAQDLENYVIVGPSGRHIAIDSAVYDTSAHTVTLRPSKKINLHHDYQFTIIGTGSNGVAGVGHALLDGEYDGKPASNCVTTSCKGGQRLALRRELFGARGRPFQRSQGWLMPMMTQGIFRPCAASQSAYQSSRSITMASACAADCRRSSLLVPMTASG